MVGKRGHSLPKGQTIRRERDFVTLGPSLQSPEYAFGHPGSSYDEPQLSWNAVHATLPTCCLFACLGLGDVEAEVKALDDG